MKEKIVSVELTPLFVPFKEIARRAIGESEGGYRNLFLNFFSDI